VEYPQGRTGGRGGNIQRSPQRVRGGDRVETARPLHRPWHFIDLGNILQKNGKRVYAWAFEGTWPKGKLPECNEITLEFPKGSGKNWTFPEIDQVIMLPPPEARVKLMQEQTPFIDRLIEELDQVATTSKC